MISRDRSVTLRGRRTRRIGLSARGDSAPSVYEVSTDVFGPVEKMLAANHLIGPFSGLPLFEFDEIRFILNFLGVPRDTLTGDEVAEIALWIPED